MNLPDYLEVVKHPMDLGTIRKKLEAGTYEDLDAFEADVVLMLENAMLYNGEGSQVYDMAQELMAILREDFPRVRTKAEEELEKWRSEENVCPLCLQERILFEPIFSTPVEHLRAKRSGHGLMP